MINFTNEDGTPFMDARAAAFRAIFQRLKSDVVLSAKITKWSGMPYQVPPITISDLPYVQVTLAAGPIKVASPNSHDSTLTIEISYAVNAAGADQETGWLDIINLYAHIEKAIDPFGDMTWLRAAIAAADPTAVLKQMTITQAGFGSVPLPDVNAVAGKCVLAVPINIDTCRSK